MRIPDLIPDHAYDVRKASDEVRVRLRVFTPVQNVCAAMQLATAMQRNYSGLARAEHVPRVLSQLRVSDGDLLKYA